MKRQAVTNTFQEGMVMDFNPLTTPNNVVTNCLNGTLLTFNGNEYVLQNDMGNGRVETAYLPKGYVPLGTAELGGIIYIVSYNPLNSKCQIGSFPSPERNITSDELFEEEKNPVTISDEDFIEKCENKECNDADRCISAPIIKKQLGDLVLHPGDKFLVCGNSIKNNITCTSHYKDGEEIKGYITFRFATIDNSGRIIYLDDLKKYQIENTEKSTNIKEGTASSSVSSDVDDYRRIVGSDYNIFTSKVAGNLYIIGQLEVVDYIESVTWNVLNIEDYIPETKPDPNTEEGADTNESDTNTVIVSKEGDRKRYSIQFNVQSVSERGNKLKGIKQFHKVDNDPVSTINNDRKEDLITYTINYIAKETDSVIATIIPQMPFGSLCYLKQKITLNFSDLGSNQVKNNIWQYLKLSESINLKFDINNGYVNKNITDVVLKFTELPIRVGSKSYNYNLPSRKSYSGLYTISIPFEEGIVKPNSLYKVEIKVKLDSKYETVASHYLYTNGVYNEYFNLSDKKYENFDEVFLPLTPKVKLENSSIDLTDKNTLEEGSVISSLIKGADYIQGRTTYSATGGKKINILSSLEKSFDNTFSIEGIVTNIELVDKPIKDVKSKISTLEGDEVVDSNFIKEESTLNTSDKEKVEINIENNVLLGYILKYDISLVSKISAKTTSRNVAVQKYFAPLLYYVGDFQKYCLQATFTDNTIDEIILESSLPALGMSAGGKDNQGGGGLTFVAGTANITLNTDSSASEEEVGLLINGFPDSVFSGAGLSGISRFPNNDMSRIIQDSKGYCGMVPVYLVNAGTPNIKYKGKVYKFQDSEDRGKGDGKKVEWFETENQKCGTFTSALLFLKIKDTDNYVPIDHFFKLGYLDRTEEKNRIQRYYSLLSQIYAQRPFENKVEVYTVGNFSYVNKKVQFSQKLEATIKYDDQSLKYNNKPLVRYFSKGELPKCAKIDYQNNGGQITIQSSMDYTFNIDNKWIDTYLEHHNSESISTCVAENGTGPINAPINPTANALYYVKDGGLEQITSSSPIALDIVNLKLSPSQDYSTISVVVQKDKNNKPIEYGFSNLDMLIYDIRNDYACANNSKINYLLTLYWGSHEPNYRSPTQICDKYLDTNCSISNLN